MLGPGMEGQSTIPDLGIIGEFLILFYHLLLLGVFMTNCSPSFDLNYLI